MEICKAEEETAFIDQNEKETETTLVGEVGIDFVIQAWERERLCSPLVSFFWIKVFKIIANELVLKWHLVSLYS